MYCGILSVPTWLIQVWILRASSIWWGTPTFRWLSMCTHTPLMHRTLSNCNSNALPHVIYTIHTPTSANIHQFLPTSNNFQAVSQISIKQIKRYSVNHIDNLLLYNEIAYLHTIFHVSSNSVHFLFTFSGYTISVLRKGAGTRNENVTPSFFIHTPLFFWHQGGAGRFLRRFGVFLVQFAGFWYNACNLTGYTLL